MIRRGDVVIARFPYAGGQGYKVRPAVVVQNDRLNKQIHNTLLAMITSNTRLVAIEPTQFLVDPSSADGALSGLTYLSAVKCENIANVPQYDLIDTVGNLSDSLIQKLNAGLREALELP